MDLQAILDASDDSSVDVGSGMTTEKFSSSPKRRHGGTRVRMDGLGVDVVETKTSPPSSQGGGRGNNGGGGGGGRGNGGGGGGYVMDMDLERILRENDDSSKSSSNGSSCMMDDFLAGGGGGVGGDGGLRSNDNASQGHNSIGNTTISTTPTAQMMLQNMSLSSKTNNTNSKLNHRSGGDDIDYASSSSSPLKRYVKTYKHAPPLEEDEEVEEEGCILVKENFYGYREAPSTVKAPTMESRSYEQNDMVAQGPPDRIPCVQGHLSTDTKKEEDKSNGNQQRDEDNENEKGGIDYSNDNEGGSARGKNGNRIKNSRNPEKIYGVHDPEDWAVLQAILSEADDSEDDDFGIENNKELIQAMKKKIIFEDETAGIMERLLLEKGTDDDDDVINGVGRFDVLSPLSRSSRPSDPYDHIHIRSISSLSQPSAMEGALGSSGAIGMSSSMEKHSMSAATMDVDAILRSIDDMSSDDEDEDLEDLEDKMMSVGKGAFGKNFMNDDDDDNNDEDEDDIAEFEKMVEHIKNVSQARIGANVGNSDFSAPSSKFDMEGIHKVRSNENSFNYNDEHEHSNSVPNKESKGYATGTDNNYSTPSYSKSYQAKNKYSSYSSNAMYSHGNDYEKKISKMNDSEMDKKVHKEKNDNSSLPSSHTNHGIGGTFSSYTSTRNPLTKDEYLINKGPSSFPNNNNNSVMTTTSALEAAEAYEMRLLRPAQHDTIVSPLAVKRRMKPKIELPTKMRQRRKASSSSSTTPSSITSTTTAKPSMTTTGESSQKFNFSGVLQTSPMSKLSLQLSRRQQPQQQQKPTQAQAQSQQQLSKETSQSTKMAGAIGLPTAVALSSKFIAIGSQKGFVLVFDLFETLRQQLPPPSTTSSSSSSQRCPSVTSVDLGADAETLVAGYAGGTLILWDVLRGIPFKTVTDVHTSAISSVRSLGGASGGGSYGDGPFGVVSVDAGGLVSKVVFSKSMLWSSSYSVETECLLDGSAGQILAMDVLPPVSTLLDGNGSGRQRKQRSAAAGSFARKLVLIALSSERSSFAVAVEPSVNVLHRWPRPEASTTTTTTTTTPTVLPCLSWGWASIAGVAQPTPVLARGWGPCIQLLMASFPSSDGTSGNETTTTDTLWPAFGVHDEFTVSNSVVALEWLGGRSLVYLTVTNEFTVVDTVTMTLVERLDFSTVRLVYAEFSLTRSSKTKTKTKEDSATSTTNNKTKTLINEVCVCATFQNSFRSNDDRLLVLCQDEVRSVCILDTRQRVLSLEENGEWLEALALALDHYESNVLPTERGGNDDPLADHPEFYRTNNNNSTAGDDRNSEDHAWIANLLLRYLKLAVENAPEPASPMPGLERHHNHHYFRSHSSSSPSPHNTSQRIDLAQSHFQMLAGVCIEFCVATRRLDLLFGDIFRSFQAAKHVHVFLDVLEPYVLNDRLRYVAPEAMAYFVEHCRATGDLATVERCLLHMDVTVLDFDSVISLLKKNTMYSALLHVFCHGLNDFVSPLEILLEGIFQAYDVSLSSSEGGGEDHLGSSRRGRQIPGGRTVGNNNNSWHNSSFERYGYKAILYIRYCFLGKTFPKGEPLKPEDKVSTLRPQLLRFLLQSRYDPSPSVTGYRGGATSLTPVVVGPKSYSYPYLRILCLVDAGAVLDVIALALDAPDAEFVESTPMIIETNGTGNFTVEIDVEGPDSPKKRNPGNTTATTVKTQTSMGEALTTDGGATALASENANTKIKTTTTTPHKKETNNQLCPDRQMLVSVLASIILPIAEKAADGYDHHHQHGRWQAQKAQDAFLDFMAKYLMNGVITAPKYVTTMVFARMCQKAVSAKVPAARRIEQSHIVSLLEVLPSYSFERMEVLGVVEAAGITRAALLLHKEAVASFGAQRQRNQNNRASDNTNNNNQEYDNNNNKDSNKDNYDQAMKTHAVHFGKAIECYVGDDDETFRLEVFQYIKKECMEAIINHSNNANNYNMGFSDVYTVIRSCLCQNLPSLIDLEAVMSAQLVADVCGDDDLEVILQSIADVQEGRVLYKFLNAIISGDLAKKDPAAFSVLESKLTIDQRHTFLTLMAKYHPEQVYHHLSTNFNNYSEKYNPNDCLKLCQEYEITDASAYLLEQMGNVSSALQLMLQSLEGRMMTLKRVVRSQHSYNSIHGSGADNKHNNVRRRKGMTNFYQKQQQQQQQQQQTKETDSVKQILVVALDLCERNSSLSTSANNSKPSISPSSELYGSQLWFNVLDRLVNAKSFLRLIKEQPHHAEVMTKVLSELLQITMQRMVWNVPLPDLVHKITTDHSGNELGEFREMIVCMLKTYSMEHNIFSNAADVMAQDVRALKMRKHKCKLRGSKANNVLGVPLGKNLVSMDTKILDIIPKNTSASLKKTTGTIEIKIEKRPQDLLGDTNDSSNRSGMVRLVHKRMLRKRIEEKESYQRSLGRRPHISFQTLADKQFSTKSLGELSSNGGMDRFVGILAGPEHYGRFC